MQLCTMLLDTSSCMSASTVLGWKSIKINNVVLWSIYNCGEDFFWFTYSFQEHFGCNSTKYNTFVGILKSYQNNNSSSAEVYSMVNVLLYYLYLFIFFYAWNLLQLLINSASVFLVGCQTFWRRTEFVSRFQKVCAT